MQETTNVGVAAVRAIPMQGHKRRWCGLERWVEDLEHRPNPAAKHGLPWPATEVKVAVVDEPRPFDPNANGGVPVEISPATFALLEKDERIAVRMIAGPDAGAGDASETVRLKAELAELHAKLFEQRRELAGEQERLALQHAASSKLAEESGARVAALEHDLAAAQAQLSQQSSRKQR